MVSDRVSVRQKIIRGRKECVCGGGGPEKIIEIRNSFDFVCKLLTLIISDATELVAIFSHISKWFFPLSIYFRLEALGSI